MTCITFFDFVIIVSITLPNIDHSTRTNDRERERRELKTFEKNNKTSSNQVPSMFSVYRSSVFSIASSASRRVYHSSVRSLKTSINEPVTKASSNAKVAAEKVGENAAKTEAASSSSSSSSSWIKENQFTFQLGVATVKTSAADLLAQIVAEKKSLSEVDLKRNLIFVVFGFAYLGCFQYWLMITKFRVWFP